MTEKTAGRSPPRGEPDKERERAEERALFARYKADPSSLNEEAVVEKYRPLVYKIVHGFSYPPDQMDDLVQVGMMGLVLAVRRFDLGLNFRFSTYAYRTIQGEIQRYFRDRMWAVNVPRDLKEKSLKVFKAINELGLKTGHDPTVAEVARATSLTEEQVQEALELGSAYHPQSFLDNVRDAEASFTPVVGTSGAEGADMALTKRSIFWDSLLSHLDETEGLVVRLYFFEQRTQKEIAERLETSQMNVSRIMRKALYKLRKLLAPADVDNLGML